MKLKWKEEAVSPVIATILMVSITVILASVLYVMVLGMNDTSRPTTDIPMGLNQQERNTTAVTILVAIAPTTSMVHGTAISYTHEQTPGQANATVYYPNGTLAATYVQGEWTMIYDNDTAFETGMIIQVYAPVVSHGDEVTFSGYGYGLSVFKVN